MHLQFYASVDTIDDIRDGDKGMVRNKYVKKPSDVHVSFCLDKYEVWQAIASENLYFVRLRESAE